MIPSFFIMSRQRPTLHAILARYHFGVTLLAVTLAWIAILLAGMTALKSYAHQNLDMAAQLASYGVEPGLVFNDQAALQEAIDPLIQKDGIARIRVMNSLGNPLLDLRSTTPDPAPFMTQLLLPDAVHAPIFHNGLELGGIQVWGDSGALIRFARLGLLTGIACLALTILGSMALARRIDRDLVKPLSDMAMLAHDVRLHRHFEKRVQPVGVAELDRLGGDINALLAELHGWQIGVENERAQLTHQATHDPLTTLPNRSAFDDHLRQRMDRANKADSDRAPFGLVFIDADNFKQTNDQYGHAMGDHVLIELSRRIHAVTKEQDFAARLGGDEFVIVLDKIDPDFSIDQFSNQLKASVGRPIPLPGIGLYDATISVGFAFFPADGTTASDLLTAADAAMYADKFSRKL
jgi:diguanylate cyclase